MHDNYKLNLTNMKAYKLHCNLQTYNFLHSSLHEGD